MPPAFVLSQDQTLKLTWSLLTNQGPSRHRYITLERTLEICIGLKRDRLSRAVHASLPISKLVKQRSDFLNSASQRPSRRREAGFYSTSFPSSTPFLRFAFQRAAPGSRRREAVSSPPRSLRQHPFCSRFFQRLRRGSRRREAGFYAPALPLSTAILSVW